jgi:hypothetical protein
MCPWYHIRVTNSKGQTFTDLNIEDSDIKALAERFNKGNRISVGNGLISRRDVETLRIVETPGKWSGSDDYVFRAGGNVTNSYISFEPDPHLPPPDPSNPISHPDDEDIRQEVVYDAKKVFIVHGRDDAPRDELATFLWGLNLEPLVLSDQVKEGKTIPELFEEIASDAGYGFIILTPDDVGHYRDDPKLKARARQNVILELGYFWGKLGRSRIFPLIKGEMELPSDIDGMFIHRYKEKIEERRFDIVKELRNAGYKIKF